MREYEPASLEQKWQRRWEDDGLYRADAARAEKKFYCLVMFPYPSGTLHVGHGRNYIIGDAVARYKMMRGFHVLNPMGWDAFGLPAENAAIRDNIHPSQYTFANIERMKKQLHSWGVGYDWSREVCSCKPEYYRWTQWIFLQLFKNGLAYRKTGYVNWCPSCATVLANEQVVNGGCDRCATPVVQKELEQWFFRITRYSQRLLDDLKRLDHWPERVKTMQANWIGRSEGVEIDFVWAETGRKIPCFTTRVDTIFGATYMVVAPEHPVVAEICRRDPARVREIAPFVERVRQTNRTRQIDEEIEKEGVFTGQHVINPANGAKIPLWIGNYVLMEYGSGAVMAVPCHDGRDFDFARKYGLPMIPVIRPPAGEQLPAGPEATAYEGTGALMHSGEFDGLDSETAKDRIARWMEGKGIGRRTVQFKLRDWLISRQRYWGAPIPILYCDRCGVVPVPEADLPVRLPLDVEFRPHGESPLATSAGFGKAVCPQCGGPARRELDTMDTFVDSSWYFLRYLSPGDETRAFDRAAVDKWLPVDQYIGGVEHAILHLLYSRFLTKALCDLKLIGFDEPFGALFTQGMIIKDGFKMSKSKGNVVSPDPLIQRFGADTVRLYTLFIGPPEKDAEWNEQAVEGAHRFLKRLWKLVMGNIDWMRGARPAALSLDTIRDPQARELYAKSNESVKKITGDMEGDFHFNTAIASAMELVNVCQPFAQDGVEGPERRAVFHRAMTDLVRVLAPFVPHFSEELWEALGHGQSVFRSDWPSCDEAALVKETVEIALQINGKVRSHHTVPCGIAREAVDALAREQAARLMAPGQTVRKVVYVPGKLVNVVVA